MNGSNGSNNASTNGAINIYPETQKQLENASRAAVPPCSKNGIQQQQNKLDTIVNNNAGGPNTRHSIMRPENDMTFQHKLGLSAETSDI